MIHRARPTRPTTEPLCLLQVSMVCLVVARADKDRWEEAVKGRREEARRTMVRGMERLLAERPTPTRPAEPQVSTEPHLVALPHLLRARGWLLGSSSLRLSTSVEHWELPVADRPRKNGWPR